MKPLLLLILITAALACGQVDFSFASDPPADVTPASLNAPAESGGGSVEIDVTPRKSGDVAIDIINSRLPRVVVANIARELMRCNWRGDDDDYAGVVLGLCEKWLHGDSSYREGSIELTPLVIAERAAGAGEVDMKLWPPDAARQALPPGWRRETEPSRFFFSSKREYFSSRSVSPALDDIPPAFLVSLGERPNLSRLAAPLLAVIFAPVLLALWLRRRSAREGAGKSPIMWLSWILNGALIYWLSAVHNADITGVVARLHAGTLPAILAGMILFAGPPLGSMATCLWILGSIGGASSEARGRLIRISLAAQAALIIPLSLFVAASGTLDDPGPVAILCLPAAYVLYRAISWYGTRLQLGGLQAVTDGELTRRMAAIAQAAGAKLRGVFVLRNRLAEEVNAFASSTGVIILTQGLVERLPRRELDAVIAHETGHLSGRHVGKQSTVFWVIMLLQFPAMALLKSAVKLPEWLPIGLVLWAIYILIVARVSQRHEFDADLRAAQITRDPEAVIAALARISRIKNSPVDWGGIQGSILTHPSMKQRVLAIAQKFGVAEERALALLADPDLLGPVQTAPGADPMSAHYPLPAEFHSAGPVFNSAVMQAYAFWASWGLNAALVALLASAAVVAEWSLQPGQAVLVYLAFVPAAAWAYLRFAGWADRLLYRRLRNRIAQRLPRSKDAIFVGLLPGNRVQPVGGLYEWDMGFLSFTPGWLTYTGERTRFSIGRGAILGITVQAGPAAWDRNYAVVVMHQGGAFVVGRPDAGYSRRHGRKLEARLNAWLAGDSARDGLPQAMEPLSPPNLPALTPYAPAPWKLASAHLKKAFVLFVGTSLMITAGERWVMANHSLTSLVTLAAPMAYLLAMMPKWLRRGHA